jgi:Trk K+ transport system NAD-binding subunit
MIKALSSQLGHFLQKRASRRNLGTLLRLVLVLFVLVAIYSGIFHLLMRWEGREFSWFTGIYWTLTVMSTLGFGDITFAGDLGRAFSMCVLMTGLIFILVLLPFTFIHLFYAPWMESQSEIRAPRQLPAATKDHVLLVHYGPISQILINRLTRYQYPYFLLTPDITEALHLYDLGIKVVVGELDDPETYRKMQVQQAALVAITASDAVNTHVAFTVRELAAEVSIIATANDPASVDILELAGCSHVLQPAETLGRFLARRTHGSDVTAHVIGQYDQLLIAETTVAGTSKVGKTLAEIGLRKELGLTAVGVWERGLFQTALPETRIGANTVLVLAGTQDQLERYRELYPNIEDSDALVVVIGGGRVGRGVVNELAALGLDYRIVEQQPEVIDDSEKCILGNAADLEVLQQAGIMKASTAIITTHDDDINIYLTIYCRRLNPDIQIISRVTLERSIPTLHRAGADYVMSYASMGANAIFNLLERGNTLMVAEGLDVFKVAMPPSLVGKTIGESSIRRNTGCTVIALNIDREMQVNPDPAQPLPAEGEIILIGSTEAENSFLEQYVKSRS